jgi:hypothetical protein
MNDFYLADSCSINLNFLIYIQNLYANCNKDCEITSIFPWLPIENSAFINKSDFEIKSKDLWRMIFNSFSSNLCAEDLEYWTNIKFQFSDLFCSGYGIEQYKNIKKSFEAWYWGSGHGMCGIFSGYLVRQYYDKIVSMAELKGLNLKDTTIYLQVVYDNPPEHWELKNSNMIMVSPNAQLPTIEEIFNLCHA